MGVDIHVGGDGTRSSLSQFVHNPLFCHYHNIPSFDIVKHTTMMNSNNNTNTIDKTTTPTQPIYKMNTNNCRWLEDFPVSSNPGEVRVSTTTMLEESRGDQSALHQRVGRGSEFVNHSTEFVDHSTTLLPQINTTTTTPEPLDDLLVMQQQLRQQQSHTTTPWLSTNFFANRDLMQELSFEEEKQDEQEDDQRVHSYYPNSNFSVEQAFGDDDDDSVITGCSSDTTIGSSVMDRGGAVLSNFPGYHRNPVDHASIKLLDDISVITQKTLDSSQEKKEAMTVLPMLIVFDIDDSIDNTPRKTPTRTPQQQRQNTSTQNMTTTPMYLRALQDPTLTSYLFNMCNK